MLQQRGKGARDHPASVTATFTLLITATIQCQPAVWDLLRVCALLQPDNIPEELFRQGAEKLGARLAVVCRDEIEWNQMISMICSYSLFSRQAEKRTLSLHRLVQVVLLDTMTEAGRRQWAQRVIEALDVLFPDEECIPSQEHEQFYKLCERLMPHAMLRLHEAGTAEEFPALASLAYKAARYLHTHGRYAEAEPLYRRALHIQENKNRGKDDLLLEFFTSCCKLHPRAWCRISDPWQAYERWVTEHHERFPLSRRAFAAEVKAHGCYLDRTSTARIWRGITLVNQNHDKIMTTRDKA